jgi:hypothetical protein
MRDQNAQQLLAKVMNWQDEAEVSNYVPSIQLLADFKYDHYQRFGPGKRFVESLALWLNQFDPADRSVALDFVHQRLIYFSDAEFQHLVQTAYPDLIAQERLHLVAEEQAIPTHRIAKIRQHRRFQELQLKSLYLGLSDGARTNELRRSSDGEISNEQIWQAYELGLDKAADMVSELKSALEKSGFAIDDPRFNELKSALEKTKFVTDDQQFKALKGALEKSGFATQGPRFNLIWLLDDFSGSGNTYIRFDGKQGKYKGKIKRVYERLHMGDLVDTSHYEVFLLLYVATRKAIDHIEYWSERFTAENGYKPLHVRVLCPIEDRESLTPVNAPELQGLLDNPNYYDPRASDKHIAVGGTESAQRGFAGCALPVVLSHNTPNNSVYFLWGPEPFKFFGLFPRVSRHREF